MVERVSGRDQGGEAQSSRMQLAQALRQAAATLRNAILTIADLRAGCRGAIERRDEEREGTLPYVLRPQRGDFLRQALGVPSLLHPARLVVPGIVRCEQVHVYLDVWAAWTPRCRFSTPRWRRWRPSCTRRCTCSAPASTTSICGNWHTACASPPAAP